VIVLVFAVHAAGGIETAMASIDPQRLRLFGGPDTPLLATLEKWAVPVLGSMLAQELIAVVLGSRSAEIARRAALTGGALYFVFGLIAVIIGLMGPRLMPGLENPEQLLPRVAAQQLPVLLYIVFVGAMVSAILSTVAGALLAAGALAAHNVVVPIRPALDGAAKVRIARIAVVLAGAAAYLLARHAESVYALVEEASAFGSSGIVVAAIFGLFTSFGGWRAALAALATGVGTWTTGHYVLDLPYPYLTSLAAALLAYVAIASLEPHGVIRTAS